VTGSEVRDRPFFGKLVAAAAIVVSFCAQIRSDKVDLGQFDLAHSVACMMHDAPRIAFLGLPIRNAPPGE
jgi:hypothetical protein